MQGRLDLDSAGLLLFSNDGDLTNFLLTPGRVEREYDARVEGNVSRELLSQILKKGSFFFSSSL
jgi:23S rRNA pseudouridine2605 synthase